MESELVISCVDKKSFGVKVCNKQKYFWYDDDDDDDDDAAATTTTTNSWLVISCVDKRMRWSKS